MGARLTIMTCALLAAAPLRAQTPEAPECERKPGAGEAAAAGRVTDSKTKLPLQEAQVTVEWESRRKVTVETDVAGRYIACSLPAGMRARIEASFGPADEQTLIELIEGETTTQNFELDAPRSRAAGRVVEHGSARGIEAAELQLEGSDVRAVSGTDGSFQLPDIPAGRYRLLTSHIGFGSRQDTIEVRYGALMRYTIGLAMDVIELNPIEVAVRSIVLEQRGFYSRQEHGMGTFLTRQSWEHRSPFQPSDVLRSVPGVRVVSRSGRGNVLLDRSNCAFRYLIDGVRVGETFQLDDMPTEWIEALEIYRGPASVPPEFRTSPFSGRSNCGVIVVWTRPPR